MRIGLVVSGGVDRSGRERVIPAILWLVEALARRHEVHVFSLYHEDTPGTYPLLGATVHDLGTRQVPRGWRRLAQRHRLRALLSTFPRFDALHAYWGIPAGWVATSAARTSNVPVIVTADSGEFVADHAIGYGLQRRWFDRHLLRDTMARAIRVTVCTRHMASLASRLGIEASVIPIGVPDTLFVPATPPDGPPWRLLHVAHLNPVKDQPTLLRALVAIRKNHEVHLDIAGGDTLGGTIQSLTHELGIADRVTFHGSVPQESIRALMAQAHIHVLSSRHEAAGVSTLEAAAVGVPTVGTRTGYVADWSPDAALGVEPGDADALAAGVSSLLASPSKRQALGARARDRARAFTIDSTVHAFERLYQRH